MVQVTRVSKRSSTIALDCTRTSYSFRELLVLIIIVSSISLFHTHVSTNYFVYSITGKKWCFASIYCTCFETQIALMTIIYICICKYRQYNGNLANKHKSRIIILMCSSERNNLRGILQIERDVLCSNHTYCIHHTYASSCINCSFLCSGS